MHSNEMKPIVLKAVLFKPLYFLHDFNAD